MFTVIETSVFIKYAKHIWVDDERIEFINWIALNPINKLNTLDCAESIGGRCNR